jgi:threonine dehydrogenase-like Zn-dependent dehydrogenase
MRERYLIGLACGCGDCEDCLEYEQHMTKRDEIARRVRHTIVPMHKSNYVVVTDMTLLTQLTRPGRY